MANSTKQAHLAEIVGRMGHCCQVENRIIGNVWPLAMALGRLNFAETKKGGTSRYRPFNQI
ncbi:hypothetical protein L0666_00880 [Octadecabacter sp. CECT 8868]|uniref:hypothetical protein n=1 Tax=Octadecabacter algicola TaxID=2909342 RepID=UPI001F27068D|nr:hypothetical protein [Octadecabacter algicola]MCF2903529.1 hypothetical protein [Octadecabacter algicola]